MRPAKPTAAAPNRPVQREDAPRQAVPAPRPAAVTQRSAAAGPRAPFPEAARDQALARDLRAAEALVAASQDGLAEVAERLEEVAGTGLAADLSAEDAARIAETLDELATAAQDLRFQGTSILSGADQPFAVRSTGDGKRFVRFVLPSASPEALGLPPAGAWRELEAPDREAVVHEARRRLTAAQSHLLTTAHELASARAGLARSSNGAGPSGPLREVEPALARARETAESILQEPGRALRVQGGVDPTRGYGLLELDA